MVLKMEYWFESRHSLNHWWATQDFSSPQKKLKVDIHKAQSFLSHMKKCYAWKESCVIGKAGEIGIYCSPETYKNGWCYSIRKTSKGDKSSPRLSPFWACVFIHLFCLVLLLLFWRFGFSLIIFAGFSFFFFFAALQMNRRVKCDKSFKTCMHVFLLTNNFLSSAWTVSVWDLIHLDQMPEHLYNGHLFPLQVGSLIKL